MSKKTTSVKLFSVIINIILAVISFSGIILGLLLISPFPPVDYSNSGPSVFCGDFLFGLILIAFSYTIPITGNLILYNIWYSRKDIRKKWVVMSYILIDTGLMLLMLCIIILENYISGWMNAIWY